MIGKEYIGHNLRTYIYFCCATLEPRAYKSSSVKFQTILQRRQSMIVWCQRKCEDNVSLKEMWNITQEVCLAARDEFLEKRKPCEKEFHTITQVLT